MTRALFAIATVLGALALLLLAPRRKAAPRPDDMAQPFLDSRNSATYLYNAATGVVSSYN